MHTNVKDEKISNIYEEKSDRNLTQISELKSIKTDHKSVYHTSNIEGFGYTLFITEIDLNNVSEI
jgi:hypothetical protein